MKRVSKYWQRCRDSGTGRFVSRAFERLHRLTTTAKAILRKPKD